MQTLSLKNEELIPQVGQMIREGHTVTMTVRGRSMRPFIEDGRDRVVLSAPGHIQKGDVILAHTKEKGFVIHRLMRIDEATGACVLQGDGNLDIEHCHKEDILAKITTILRKKKGTPYPTSGRIWRAYSSVWTALRPFRRYLLAIWRRLALNEWGHTPRRSNQPDPPNQDKRPCP